MQFSFLLLNIAVDKKEIILFFQNILLSTPLTIHTFFTLFLGTLLLSGPTMRSPGWSQRLHSPSPKICDSGSFNFPKRFGSHRSLGSARLCAVSPIFIPERPHVFHFCRHLTILLFLFQQAPQKLRNGIFLFAISKKSPILLPYRCVLSPNQRGPRDYAKDAKFLDCF